MDRTQTLAEAGGGNMKYRNGLVVGKFAPLHRGHELVISRALALCERVHVLSYSKPELPSCDPAQRRAWIARSFPAVHCVVVDDAWLRAHGAHDSIVVPSNDAPDEVQRDFVSYLCREQLQIPVDVVFTSEDYGDGFARSLTAGLRARWPAHASIEHVSIDRARQLVPISGTLIRADPHAHRDYLSAHVYAAFVERIAILGGESTGKSTLAAALARHFATQYVAEYGRELWEARAGRLEYADLLAIAEQQVEREQRAGEQSYRYAFCDTSPATTLLYCLDLFGRAEQRLRALATRRYTLQILCAPDFPFVQDGTRRDDAFRHEQHDWYLKQLEKSGERWLLVTGSLDERIGQVQEALSRT